MTETRNPLWQDMCRCHRSAEGTRRVRPDNVVLIVIPTDGAGRDAARFIQFDISRQIRGEVNGLTGGRAMFDGELIGRCVNLAKIIDARIGLTFGAGLDEVRNCDGRQQTNNRNDNHDFHECEARMPDAFIGVHKFALQNSNII